VLALGAVAGAGLVLQRPSVFAADSGPVVCRLDFAGAAPGEGWGPGWRCSGVANLRRAAGEGRLEAGSDVFPNDPRPVAFAVDCRLLEATIRALIAESGAGAGVVLRRTSPWAYYAAIYDAERLELAILRRSGSDLVTLASAPAQLALPPFTLELSATGSAPTSLTATLRGAGGIVVEASASDRRPELQHPGDPGVLATARTLFPSGNPVLPALGNLHLLPWAVQEGQAFMATPPGQAIVDEIRRQSTAVFREIEVRSGERPRRTAPSVAAATTGVPLARGARLHVATDVPAKVSIEVSSSPGFRRVRELRAERTGSFDALTGAVRGLRRGRRAYWRAKVQRAGVATTGPVRSFRVPPRPGSPARVTLAVASCGAQFGAIFDHLAQRRPDVFVWQGDLNYPDTHGPLAQTMSGYAGIWRDFLANPRLEPVLERTAFVAMRDDHDYGLQDANSTNLVEFGLAPWDALLGAGLGYRFAAGLAEVWVLDQRRLKSNPELPDGAGKTLLGDHQRKWLLRTLAESKAPFKVVCSPCTVFLPANPRDGQWATKFTAERDLILDHVARRVSGRTVFVSGDTHLTAVYDADGHFEARATPIDIPAPNDITLTDPLLAQRLRQQPDIAYADEQGHFALLEIRGHGRTASLELALVRQDGTTPYRRRFEEPIPPVVMRIRLDRASLRGIRRSRLVRGRLFLDRPGRVRVRGLLGRRAGRTRVRLARRVVRVRRPGWVRFRLRLTRRARAALRGPGPRRGLRRARRR
jgi:hypothetical protein